MIEQAGYIAKAQDQVQMAAWKAFAHLDQYQGAAEFSTWLLRIVENECLMLLRLKKRSQLLYLDADSGADGAGPVESSRRRCRSRTRPDKQQLDRKSVV